MARPGLLLINLGSPDSPMTPDVRRYLSEFLTDPLVINIPWLQRQLLVRGLIAPLRAPKSAEAYRKIWLEEGSPLVVLSQAFTEKLKQRLQGRFDVRLGMRYGRPSLAFQLKGWNIDELYVVPMYPQYALSSTQTALNEVKRLVDESGREIKVRVLKDFFAEPEFIQSQSEQIRTHMEDFKPDHVLLSFHGLPEDHLTSIHPEQCLKRPGCCERVVESNRWCYRAQAMETARQLVSALQLPGPQLSIGFQSRLGRKPWIKPFTDEVVSELGRSKVRRLLVSCPSFVTDCLETLEEIQMRTREDFIAAGGVDLRLVPALNAEDHWVDNFAHMITRTSLAWSEI